MLNGKGTATPKSRLIARPKPDMIAVPAYWPSNWTLEKRARTVRGGLASRSGEMP